MMCPLLMLRCSALPVQPLEVLTALLLLQVRAFGGTELWSGLPVLHNQDLVDAGAEEQEPDQQAFMPAQGAVH